MLTTLIRIFIKDKDNYTDAKVREQYGTLCGGYGIFLNIVLFGIKYLAGVLSASIAMTADAFNNLSDAGSSVITVIGFKLAGKKPDPRHPFGHGRIEYLSGLAVATIIIVMGYELIKDSFLKILHPEPIEWSPIALAILGISIAIKLYMAFYNKKIGKKIDSQPMLATSADSLSDTISTTVVALCTIIAHFTNLKLDGWCGIAVGILIVVTGIKSAIETIGPLLGEPPSEEFIKSVEDIVMSHEEIIGIHDMVVHDYGPGRVMITLHAEVPANGDIIMLHDVVDCTEGELRSKLNCQATIHMDPVVVGDPVVDELKTYVSEVIGRYTNMKFHDFRTVIGPTHTNLIFDIVVSFDDKRTDDEIANEIAEVIHSEHDEYFAVINVDRDYQGK